MNDPDHDELRQIVERRHGGTARLIQSVPVRDARDGKIMWEGIVYIFALRRHASTDRAYTWVSATEQDGQWVASVLHGGRVTSPLDAVRATATISA